MPADDLTPAQLAALLEADSSTVRRWARAFAQHLSPGAAGQGGRRRYSRDDLAVLARAKELLRSGKSPAEVNAILATAPDLAVEVPAVAHVALPALAQDLAAAQEALRAALSRLDALQAAQAADRARLDQLEQELAAWRSRPWWRRVFGRPPENKTHQQP
jgi:DNA-binding transcriptional MerR regulator